MGCCDLENMVNFSNFSKEELNEILDLAYDMKKSPESMQTH